MSKSTQAHGKGAITLGQLIENATVQDCENSMIMQICDVINSSVDGPREAVKGIRKCFATKSSSVIKLSLILLEACVKNCGMRFHVQIASREFLEDFLKILKAKYNHSREIQMTVLDLLQSWAFAFQNIPELKEVIKTYQDLKNKNVEFPPLDPDKTIELEIPVKVTDSTGATDLLLPEGGQMHSRTLLPTGAGSQTSRRSSAGVIRSGLSPTGMDSHQVRRPSAATVQSYLLPTGTVFQNSRRPSAESIQSIRRTSADMIHHSVLSPTGIDNENSRRRPSADMFHQPSLAPGGTDNEKTRRRNSRDIVHNSSLSPMGTDNEKSRRRPSTGMVQLSCLSPTGTDSDKTRRRLSIESQSRRASMESLYRRASLEEQYRRASIESQNLRTSLESQNLRTSLESQNLRTSLESQNRRPSGQSQSASRSSEGHPVSSSPSAQSGVEQPVTAAGIKCHLDQVAPVSTTAAAAGSVVNNLIDLGGSPSSGTGASSQPPVAITKQPISTSPDGSSVKANDSCNPCIVVTTIEEEVIFDREDEIAEMEQWVMQN